MAEEMHNVAKVVIQCFSMPCSSQIFRGVIRPTVPFKILGLGGGTATPLTFQGKLYHHIFF